MNTTKEREKILKSMEKVRAERAAFIQRAIDKKRKTAKDLKAAVGDDAPVNVPDTLDINDTEILNQIESVYNSVLGNYTEQLRQLEIIDKKKRLEELPQIIEETARSVDLLRIELPAKEGRLQALKNEVQTLTTQVNFSSMSDRSRYYKPQAATLLDSRIQSINKQQTLSFIMNY